MPGKHGIIIEFEEPDNAEAKEEENRSCGVVDEGEKKSSRSLRSRLRGGNSSSSAPPSAPPPARRSVLSATYLPQVATEQGWNLEEAIHSLIRKAGFGGKITESLKRELVLTRYESSMAGMGWREYQREREKETGG